MLAPKQAHVNLRWTIVYTEIIGLVTEMHSCCDKIIDLFNGKGVSAEGYAYRDESIMTNPAKLSYVIVQSLRELAVGKFPNWPTKIDQIT